MALRWKALIRVDSLAFRMGSSFGGVLKAFLLLLPRAKFETGPESAELICRPFELSPRFRDRIIIGLTASERSILFILGE